MNGPLTAHFTWAEVVRSPTARARGIDNTVPEELWANIRRTAAMMEAIRSLLGGSPLKINSWYRCPILNTAVGGSPTSAHPKGLAVDWEPTTMLLGDAFDAVAASPIVFDQLIHEGTKDGADWIHTGLSVGPPRRQILTAAGDALGGPMRFTRLAAG